MSQPRPPRLQPFLLDELEGLSWEWVMGTKHWQLRINGDLIAIWPRGTTRDMGKNDYSVRATIRKWKARH